MARTQNLKRWTRYAPATVLTDRCSFCLSTPAGSRGGQVVRAESCPGWVFRYPTGVKRHGRVVRCPRCGRRRRG